VPTVTLNYPSNIQAGPGHNWAQRHLDGDADRPQGIQYGAKVVALTVIDILTKPEIVTQAWDYFKNVQTKDRKYVALIRPRITGDLVEQRTDGEVPGWR